MGDKCHLENSLDNARDIGAYGVRILLRRGRPEPGSSSLASSICFNLLLSPLCEHSLHVGAAFSKRRRKSPAEERTIWQNQSTHGAIF
jgi:hypothetical protein